MKTTQRRMTRQERADRIAHYRQVLDRMEAERRRGFADLVAHDGHTITTAAELDSSSWRLICSIRDSLKRLGFDPWN